MNPTIDLEQVYQGIKGGTASGRGVSYWDNDNAAVCGRKLHLTMLHKDLVAAGEANADEKGIGTFYHGLMDMWFKGKMPEGVTLDIGPVQDMAWAEAIRLFNFTREHFTREYFGQCMGSEVRLPMNEEHAAQVEAFFGHREGTGAMDMLARLSLDDIARLRQDWGISLPGPGLYVWDWKTAGARKSAQAAEAEYTDSMQAKMYPSLWNIAGGEQVLGTIYFVLVKHDQLRRFDVNSRTLSSVQVFFARWEPIHAEIVKVGLRRARKNRDEAEPNPFACRLKGRPCPFLGTLCNRT